MNLDNLAPETKESLNTSTISISINNNVLRDLDDLVEYARKEGRRTNRSKIVENSIKEALANLTWR